MTNKKITIISNLVLSVLIIFVLSVSLLPLKNSQYTLTLDGKPIFNGNKNKNNVSLMFNVYEGTEIVNGILDVLKEYGVKATFFVGGCWADDNRETIENIYNLEHEIGNHGYFHKDHKKLSYSDNLSEIDNNTKLIKSFIGVNMTLFAPPSGSFNDNTLSCANSLNYKVIMWSKDTIDWRDSDCNLILNRATKNLTNGDLILMHPKKHTLEVLPKIIEKILDSGFNIVTVGQNIG